MVIIKHVVTEQDASKIIEPAGFTVWLLQFDSGDYVEAPNGKLVSSRHRQLIEVIYFELVTNDTLKPRDIKTCFDWHMDNLLGRWNILASVDELPLIVLDDLLLDSFLFDYMDDRYDPYFAFIHDFFRKNNLRDAWVSPKLFPKDFRESNTKAGGVSKAILLKWDKKSKKNMLRIYQAIIEKVDTLGAPDMNLLVISKNFANSMILRLFWVLNLISSEYLVLMDDTDDVNLSNLKSLENLKRYRNLLHDGNQAYDDLLELFPSRIWEMPNEAIVALKAGVKAMTRDYQLDFSLCINSISKSLEIILKTQIFDAFRKSYGYSFDESTELRISDKKSKAQKLISFIEKPPHFIEMGSMEFILTLHGGKTASKEPILSNLFEFIKSKSGFPNVVNKDFLSKLGEIRKIRNLKTHSEITESGYEAVQFMLLIQSVYRELFED